jgi:hypothetical protein
MKIRSLPPDFDRALLLGTSEGRSTGLHLSDIIKDLLVALEPERFGGPMHEEYVALGLAWEQFLEQIVPGSRPEEFESDGIAMSPDWIHRDGTPEEWKVNWSTNKDGLDHPGLARYHIQAKAYARVLGSAEMRFRVLWVNGDYRPPRPALQTYRVRYTRRELEENWDMIRQHAEDMGVLTR